VLKALTQRDFSILWSGQTISLFGDGIFTVALAWQALELPSGAAGLGLVLLVRSLSRVGMLLFGGALADRYPKRNLMLIGDALQFVAVAWLAVVVSGGDLHLWQLAVVSGATGIGAGIFLSSSAAIVPELVDEGHFQSANSLRSFSFLLGNDLIGPAVGGVLVAGLGTAIAFAIDAATFLASIIALTLIRTQSRRALADGGSKLFREVKEGLSYVSQTPWLWVSLVAVGTVGNFASFGPLPVLIPLLVRDRLAGGADVLGMVLAGYGLGGVIGALFTGSRRIRLHSVVPAFLAWGVGAISLGSLAFTPSAAAAIAALAITGFAGQSAEVIWVTLQQTFVPRRLLGRVISTDWLVSLSLQPLGVALAAPVAAAIGVGGAFFWGAVATVSAIGVGLTNRNVRLLEKPGESD
jgi:predicted MFS family arabinose efflux permease